MKKVFSILVITAMMLPNLTKIGILIDFKINQDFIAKVLCVNKDEPIKMCNGKCYLSEQLKKAEEQEEKQAPTSKKDKLEVTYYYSKSSFEFSDCVDTYLSKINPASENELFTSSFISDIFRPPRFNLI